MLWIIERIDLLQETKWEWTWVFLFLTLSLGTSFIYGFDRSKSSMINYRWVSPCWIVPNRARYFNMTKATNGRWWFHLGTLTSVGWEGLYKFLKTTYSSKSSNWEQSQSQTEKGDQGRTSYLCCFISDTWIELGFLFSPKYTLYQFFPESFGWRHRNNELGVRDLGSSSWSVLKSM